MKKTLTLISAVLIFLGANAQEIRTAPSAPFQAPKYSNDVIIDTNSAFDHQEVKLAVAFNGWLYAAASTIDSANNSGGLKLKTSRDGGETWQGISDFSFENTRFPTFDIVVAGTDTNDLKLFMVGVNYSVSDGTNVLFVDQYNATTLHFVANPLRLVKGTQLVRDVAIASDYRFPSVASNPYSVAVAYSVYGGTDSINSVVSLDGGVTFNVFQNVATTANYFRNVSIAYGKSSSGSNGRYFMAWERLSSFNNRTGNIYSSRNVSDVSSVWIPPVNLDSVSTSMIGLCRNPSIAVQFNNIDNDSSSNTAVVLVERDFDGAGTDYDLLGFYNKRSHYTNYWFRLDIVNSGEIDMMPDITYDPGNNNFLAVYFDSTEKKLPYIINNMNLTVPGTWSPISTQYNDSPNLSRPYPQVEINPAMNQVAHVWIADGSGAKGVAMFDAEYSTISISETDQQSTGALYPNPATSEVSLMLPDVLAGSMINVYDLQGKLIESRKLQNFQAGNSFEKFNVSQWENGLYFFAVSSEKEVKTYKLVVSH